MDATDITGRLEKIEEAVFTALTYGFYPMEKIEGILQSIDALFSKKESLDACGSYFATRGDSNVLYFISNILYNMKTKSSLALTPDAFKWLGSVWKNFLMRNRKYQEHHQMFLDYKDRLGKYFPGGNLIHKIENVHLVTRDFIVDSEDENTPLRNLERFHKIFSELLSWMKPTYYFMLDYYSEWQSRGNPEERRLETGSLETLKGFGHPGYTYGSIVYVTCQSLALLEALYLVLKKKKTSRQIFSMDGKSRLLSTSEIYELYRDKFQESREELARLK